jgi:hypothetical protein
MYAVTYTFVLLLSSSQLHHHTSSHMMPSHCMGDILSLLSKIWLLGLHLHDIMMSDMSHVVACVSSAVLLIEWSESCVIANQVIENQMDGQQENVARLAYGLTNTFTLLYLLLRNTKPAMGSGRAARIAPAARCDFMGGLIGMHPMYGKRPPVRERQRCC